jgi:uncharacterized protein (DUF1499 family)
VRSLVRFARPEAPSFFARWTSRIALFAVVLVATAVVLHRLLGMPTPVALNLIKLAFAGAILALVLAVLAAARIWRTGEPGTARVVVAVLAGLGLLGWPLVYAPTVARLPEINDVTTDTASPPPFVVLAAQRPPGANAPQYPGEAFALRQRDAYPDLQPLRIERSVEETFEIAAEALRRQRMTIVREEPPAAGRPGALEAVDRTLVMGFTDDVAVRVTGDQAQAVIDIRSASRYGRHDLGRNAERIRRVLREIVARLEATVPAAGVPRNVRLKSRNERAVLKRLKERDPRSAGRRTSGAPSR